MADYSGERAEPAASGCGTVSLLFDGYYLKVMTGFDSEPLRARQILT